MKNKTLGTFLLNLTVALISVGVLFPLFGFLHTDDDINFAIIVIAAGLAVLGYFAAEHELED